VRGHTGQQTYIGRHSWPGGQHSCMERPTSLPGCLSSVAGRNDIYNKTEIPAAMCT